jgi:hypothetical protein
VREPSRRADVFGISEPPILEDERYGLRSLLDRSGENVGDGVYISEPRFTMPPSIVTMVPVV